MIAIPGRRPRIIGSKYTESRRDALRGSFYLAARNSGLDLPLRQKLWVRCTFDYPSTEESLADLVNLYQFPFDLLQKDGVILDDQQIRSHDGSRVWPLCPGCARLAGRKVSTCAPGDASRCPRARTVLEIYDYHAALTVTELPTKGVKRGE
jgi:hypothetical protein